MHVGGNTGPEAARTHRRQGGGRGAGGFTLTELMVVIAIIAIVSVIAFFGLARPSAASQTTAIGRDLYFALNRARLQATTGGSQIRVWLCRSADSTCPRAGIWFIQINDKLGRDAPDNWVAAGEEGRLSKTDAAVTAIVNLSGATLGANVNASVTFMPDGSTGTGTNEARIITVDSTNGATSFSIRIFSATGLVRLWRTK